MVTTTPLDAVAELQRLVAKLAPAVRPQVLPKGAAYGLDLLLSLCASDELRQSLRDELNKHRPSGRSADAAPFVVGTLDVEKKVFSIDSVQWLEGDDALIHQFPRFIELQLESPEQAKDVISHFLTTNGHSVDDVMTAQQCFNAAFALQTLLRAFPKPQVAVRGTVVDVREASDVRRVLELLYPRAAAASASSSSGDKKSKKSKNNKKRQRQ
ncbi:hypothetical protein P43SY_009608 [Pythium insidiosum]|uniref:Uncharacterized protein n=1 Tax=Pythium insidiosum TaxID=114742 RepID=A0AAD5LLX3_PYTIN|nr:hypothetical protein P43SY_009608 [Pythium insidiosum]